MYVYMYMYVYIHICMHAHIYTYIYIRPSPLVTRGGEGEHLQVCEEHALRTSCELTAN